MLPRLELRRQLFANLCDFLRERTQDVGTGRLHQVPPTIQQLADLAESSDTMQRLVVELASDGESSADQLHRILRNLGVYHELHAGASTVELWERVSSVLSTSPKPRILILLDGCRFPKAFFDFAGHTISKLTTEEGRVFAPDREFKGLPETELDDTFQHRWFLEVTSPEASAASSSLDSDPLEVIRKHWPTILGLVLYNPVAFACPVVLKIGKDWTCERLLWGPPSIECVNGIEANAAEFFEGVPDADLETHVRNRLPSFSRTRCRNLVDAFQHRSLQPEASPLESYIVSSDEWDRFSRFGDRWTQWMAALRHDHRIEMAAAHLLAGVWFYGVDTFWNESHAGQQPHRPPLSAWDETVHDQSLLRLAFCADSMLLAGEQGAKAKRLGIRMSAMVPSLPGIDDVKEFARRLYNWRNGVVHGGSQERLRAPRHRDHLFHAIVISHSTAS